MLDFFRDEPIIGTILTLLLAGLIFIIVDDLCSKPVYFQGTVIDKQYKGETNSTGIGTGVASNGQVGTVITSQHEDEKFLLIVQDATGEISTAECEAKLYYSKQINAPVRCYWLKGKFTPINYGIYGLE